MTVQLQLCQSTICLLFHPTKYSFFPHTDKLINTLPQSLMHFLFPPSFLKASFPGSLNSGLFDSDKAPKIGPGIRSQKDL